MKRVFFFAVWVALAGFPGWAAEQQPKVEEAKPVALADVRSLAGDWELPIDPKKSPLKALRATIVMTEAKATGNAVVARGNIVFHYSIETAAITEETVNTPEGGIRFQVMARGKKRYLQILPDGPVKPEKLIVEFTLEKDSWTINAAASKSYFFPRTISGFDLRWNNLVWKRIPAKGK